MTYQRIEDLPQDVREYLIEEQVQQTFLVTFNRFVKRGCDQGSAFQLAWQALSLTSDDYEQAVDKS